MLRRRLEIEDGPLSLPLSEVSGICHAYGTQRQEPRLLAIGDDSPIVIAVDIEPEPNGRPVPKDLTRVLSASTAEMGNWEAVATDGDGRVFILQEDPGAVVILDADFQQLLHTVHLHVDPDRAPGVGWKSEPGSRGEGLVLLGHGHLLVIKEKKPKRLLEFGPGGAAARGISPSTVLPVQERFPVPSNTARIEFELLKQWKFDDAAEREMDDLSDAAVGPDGRIYLLSDQSRRIARIQERVGPGEEHVGLDASWDLPAQIAKPEGLTISHNWTPIVAVDKQEQERNLYILRNLWA
jgi:uncharacterized protein YjiK